MLQLGKISSENVDTFFFWQNMFKCISDNFRQYGRLQMLRPTFLKMLELTEVHFTGNQKFHKSKNGETQKLQYLRNGSSWSKKTYIFFICRQNCIFLKNKFDKPPTTVEPWEVKIANLHRLPFVPLDLF